jgi:hypothetical protein
MNLPVQPGAGTRDGGVFVRRVSVTESGAQSANFAGHPGDRSLHVSLTSSDGAVCAVVMTRDAVHQLAMTIGGGAVSIMALTATASHATPPSASGARPVPIRHRLHLGHFPRNAPNWNAPAEPWR